MEFVEDVAEALALAGDGAAKLVGVAEMGWPPAMQALQRRWLRARHCFFEYACEGSASAAGISSPPLAGIPFETR